MRMNLDDFRAGLEAAAQHIEKHLFVDGRHRPCCLGQDTGKMLAAEIRKLPAPSLLPTVADINEQNFNRFYAEYPRKEDKKSARKAWDKIVKTRVNIETVINAAARYAHETEGRESKHIKLPATWLNGECWNNAPALSQPRRGAQAASLFDVSRELAGR